VSEPLPLPEGFAVGHWTELDAETGCTVVIPPPRTRAAADVRGGGPGTRELDVLESRANPEEATAIVLAGGSAFGLAAADGASRWLEENERGYETFAGRVPLVPAAVIYDLASGRGDVRPDAESGYAACEAARGGVPERGRVGVGAGAGVGKILGRERGTPSGVGYAAVEIGSGERVAAVAVCNAAGDVIDVDGSVLGGPHGEDGTILRSAELIVGMTDPPPWSQGVGHNTTLVCVCTDAALTKPGCGAVARMASAGMARAVDPVFSPVDGDVVFCLASGRAEMGPWAVMSVGTAAATVAAAAIRDAVRSAAGAR
jgi:L-aminopeptidase/D-esterase-like protein